jgi:hypothetical protein
MTSGVEAFRLVGCLTPVGLSPRRCLEPIVAHGRDRAD